MSASESEIEEDAAEQEFPVVDLAFGIGTALLMAAIFVSGFYFMRAHGYWVLAGMVMLAFVVKAIPNDSALPGRNVFRENLMWGIVLPLLCLIYAASFIYSPASAAGLFDFCAGVFILQMALLLAWSLVGPRKATWNGLNYGAFHIGIIFMSISALLLLIPAVMLTIVLGMGLPGFVPLMAYSIIRQAQNSVLTHLPAEPVGKKQFHRASRIGSALAIWLPATYVYMGSKIGLPYRLPRVELQPLQNLALWKLF